MEKKTILKIISIIMAVIAIFVIVCAASVTGGGFLDLSNIVKISCILIAVVCAVLSAVLWKRSKNL
ncbi:MAG: hypothetical protein E7479_00190 [Ruminococcaceae bacterium]|nr:hypothetical protein [Oscillospiraceae bacterium]